MTQQPSPTVHELLVHATEIYCGQRHLAGASATQIRQELAGAWFQALDREFSGKPWMSSNNGWPAPMDERAFRGIAGEFVRVVEPHTESDRVGLLVQLLTAFGSAAGRNAYVLVEADRHYPNLYALIIGETARARKGTSWRRVEALMRLADEDWARDRLINGGLSSGEGVTSRVRDANEASKDPGISDKRLLVAEGEFSAVQKVLEREGNTLSPVLRSAWDTGNLNIQTKNNPCRATGAHISIVAHVTRDEFLARLDRSELSGGTMNRFLHVASKRSKLLHSGGRIPDSEMQRLATEVKESLAIARREREVSLTRGARALWQTAYPHLTADRFGQYGAATARAEAQVLRIALIFALLDRSEQIGEGHLWAALAVVDYCDRSAAYVYGERHSDRAQDSVLDAIRTHEGWMSRTELVNALHRHVAGLRLQSALDALLLAGLIERREERTVGRPREEFHAIKARKASVLELCSLPSQDSPGDFDASPSDSYPEDERDAIQDERAADAGDTFDEGREA